MNANKRTARKRFYLISGLPVDTDEQYCLWKREQRLLAANAMQCSDECEDHNEAFPVARVVTATAIGAIIVAIAFGILSHC